MIYLITVNYYSADLVQTLLESVRSQGAEFSVVIVNNSPEDHQVRSLVGPQVKLLETGYNAGFGEGCNVGLRWVYEQEPGAIAWLINPDTTLQADALAQAQHYCTAHPEISLLGTVIDQPDGTIWFAGGAFNPATGRIVAQEQLPSPTIAAWETAWITGCSLIINLRHFATCPEFDPAFFLYYEDFDFCRRYLAQGHLLRVVAAIRVTHCPSSIAHRDRPKALEHSTYSYLVALERHTSPLVLLYRLARIVAHAARRYLVDSARAIAIIKGVLHYGERVSRFGQSRQH